MTHTQLAGAQMCWFIKPPKELEASGLDRAMQDGSFYINPVFLRAIAHPLALL